MAKPKRLSVPFPKHGYTGYLLQGETPKGVTQDAANVFGEYPGTKRQQGGQRPGLKRKTAAPLPGGRIEAGISVAHDQAPDNYTDGPVTEEWAHTSLTLQGATDVRVDEYGNSFFLDKAGVITKRNSDGVEVYTAQLPVTASLQACPRILLVDGGLVAGGSSTIGSNNAVLWKFDEREERDGLDLVGALLLDASEIVAIEPNGSAAMVAVNGSSANAEVLTVLGVLGSEMAISVRHSVPHPVGDVAVGPRGIYSTSRPDATRGEAASGEGFAAPNVDWTPEELTPNPTERLHAWYDADFAGAFVNGAPAIGWADYRISGEIAVPDDDTDRSLVIPPYGYESGARGPTAPIWGQHSIGSAAGLTFRPESSSAQGYFAGGDSLYTSTLNMTNLVRRGAKSTAAGALPAARGIWPVNSAGYKFATTLVLRWKEGSAPSVAWSIGSQRDGDDPGTSFFGWNYNGLFITVNDGGNDLSGPGWLTGIPVDPLTQSNGGICLRGACLSNPIAVEAGVATGFNPGSPLRMAIVTIVNNGAGAVDFRVNGVTAATGISIDDTLWESNSEVIGSRYTTRHNPVISDATSFDGVLAGAVTIMGDTGVDIHDTAVPLTDVQKVEGYLAHRYGCALDALDSTLPHPYRLAPPGGTGSLPSSDATAKALRSRYGILMKLDPGGTGALWAMAGGGIGDAVVADDDGGVICMGPQAKAVDPFYHDARLGPLMRTAVKVIDRGLVFDAPLQSEGFIQFDGDPLTGEYFTISDGINTETFEWWDGVSPQVVPGSTQIALIGGTPPPGGWGAGLYARAASVFVAISTNINMDADHDGAPDAPQAVLYLASREAPTGVATPIVVSAGSMTVVDGMTGPPAWPTGTWAAMGDHSQTPLNRNPRAVVDQGGAFYAPLAIAAASNIVYRRNGETGAIENLYRAGGGSSAYQVNAVAIDSNFDELYPVEGPEFMWVAADNIDGTVDDTRETQYRARWIASTPNGLPPRKVTSLAVSGGKIYEVSDAGAATALESSPSFTPGAFGVQMATLFGEVFIIENGVYRVVNLKRQTVETWEPKTAGQMPEKARLLTAYRGRAVMARTKTSPHGLYASAHGDPYDWDVARSLTEITGAFEGTSTKRNPDMIQALCPFYDDFLIVGGASSITQFRGDLSAAGSIDLFTDATGIAFGDTYALAPSGILFFFGSRGGVWAMQPGTDGRSNPPIEITEQTVGRELGEVDLSIYQPRLIWDTDRKGLHVLLIYIGPGVNPAPVRHWFYSESNKAWWPVEFGSSLALPSAVWTKHGDTPEERSTIMGWNDGHLREWDDDSASDDGVAIDSHVLLGPIGDTQREYGIFEILASVAQVGSGIRYEVFASDDPEELGLPIHSGTLSPGFNGSVRARGRGSSLWIRLISAKLDESWGLNELGITLADMGARRHR